MANTLKIVLILVGLVLIGYGLYTLLFPGNSLGFGAFQVENEDSNSQIFAMIGFGVLTLIGGIAYKKR